jgi:hypothetical protein
MSNLFKSFSGLAFALMCLLLAPTLARGDDLDNNNDLLKCDDRSAIISAMDGILIVSWSDGSKVCDLATRSLDQPIKIGVFRVLLKASGTQRWGNRPAQLVDS